MSVSKDKYYSWDYSEKSDILNVHKVDKKTAGSAELGDFTVDFDKNGNIVGVEILNASEFFTLLGILKTQLENIKEAEIIMRKRGEMTLICLKLLLSGEEAPRIVSLPASVMNEAPITATA